MPVKYQPTAHLVERRISYLTDTNATALTSPDLCATVFLGLFARYVIRIVVCINWPDLNAETIAGQCIARNAPRELAEVICRIDARPNVLRCKPELAELVLREL